jgi:hypothetical protein
MVLENYKYLVPDEDGYTVKPNVDLYSTQLTTGRPITRQQYYTGVIPANKLDGVSYHMTAQYTVGWLKANFIIGCYKQWLRNLAAAVDRELSTRSLVPDPSSSFNYTGVVNGWFVNFLGCFSANQPSITKVNGRSYTISAQYDGYVTIGYGDDEFKTNILAFTNNPSLFQDV